MLSPLLLLACGPRDLWPDAHDACTDSGAACGAILDAHFGVEVEGAHQRVVLQGLEYMVLWELGPDCPDWAPVGESGAACFYNTAAARVRRTVRDIGAQPYFELEGTTLQVGVLPAAEHPFNFGLNMADELAGVCGMNWIGQQGLPHADEDVDMMYWIAANLRLDECDDPWAGG